MQPIFEEIQAGDAVGFYCPISWVELLCYPDLTEAEANGSVLFPVYIELRTGEFKEKVYVYL